MPNIENAILLATTLHTGQVDKAGKPYIFHPLRVMLQMSTEEEQITAILHDVVEDCDITLSQLRSHGYSESVVEALDFLSKRPEEENDYDSFIARISKGPILARKVKLADLKDNSDLSRIAAPNDWDIRRRDKYLRAIAILEAIN